MRLENTLFHLEAIVDGSVMNTGAVVEAIKENRIEQRIQAKNANISVSGNAVIIKRIQLQKMSFDELEEQIRWEAEQYILDDIADVNIDVQILKRMKNLIKWTYCSQLQERILSPKNPYFFNSLVYRPCWLM